jgi:hypothetical protein
MGQAPGKIEFNNQPNSGHQRRASSIIKKIRRTVSMAITIHTQVGM